MNQLLYITWNIDPILVDLGTVSVKWSVVYFVLLPVLVALCYFAEKAYNEEEDDDYNPDEYKDREWYYKYSESAAVKPQKKQKKNKKSETTEKFTPYFTYAFVFFLLFSRFVYCNKRLHDVSQFLQPLNSECFQFPIQLHWYSLCWVVGLLLAYLTVRWLYEHQQISMKAFEPLFVFCFVGILLGARLGHCLFYQFDYFILDGHIAEIFIPIHQRADGTTEFTGFTGLASHGGTLGLIIALWIYCRRYCINVWHVVDNIAIATGITACFIRLGNLMNSEIVGKATDVAWAFWFTKNDPVAPLPRHPAQLYEALAYLLFFVLSLALYRVWPRKVGTGFYFGFCLTYIFTFRFFIEYTKEVQEAFEEGMLFDMGQLLSVPFIIVGIAAMTGGAWMKRLGGK